MTTTTKRRPSARARKAPPVDVAALRAEINGLKSRAESLEAALVASREARPGGARHSIATGAGPLTLWLAGPRAVWRFDGRAIAPAHVGQA